MGASAASTSKGKNQEKPSRAPTEFSSLHTFKKKYHVCLVAKIRKPPSYPCYASIGVRRLDSSGLDFILKLHNSHTLS